MHHEKRFLTRHLFLQVRDEFASRVASGEWKAGAMVSNEAQLAAELGVSQGTVRKALDLLEAEKVLVRRQGRGTFVVDQEAGEMAIRFCSIVDGNGQKIDGEIKSQCGYIKEPDEQELRHLSAVASDRILRSRRLHTRHGRPFMLEESSIVLRHWPGLEGPDYSYQRITSLAQKHGVLLSHATENARPALSTEDVSRFLEIEERTPVLFLERRVFSDKGLSVEWRIAWCHLRDEAYVSVTN